MITIVVAEDHHIVRQGLKSMLSAEKGFRLLSEAGDGMTAVELVTKLKPSSEILPHWTAAAPVPVPVAEKTPGATSTSLTVPRW